jgi:hypothetical protein
MKKKDAYIVTIGALIAIVNIMFWGLVVAALIKFVF